MNRTGDRGIGNNQKAAGFDTARPKSLVEARTRQSICRLHAAVLYAILQSRNAAKCRCAGILGIPIRKSGEENANAPTQQGYGNVVPVD